MNRALVRKRVCRSARPRVVMEVECLEFFGLNRRREAAGDYCTSAVGFVRRGPAVGFLAERT